MSDIPTFMNIGLAFFQALAVRDFDRMGKLLHPQIHFRGLLPEMVREGSTAEETLSWLRRWFGGWEVFNLEQCSLDQVGDRLHLAYRIHVRNQGEWKEVAQHLFCRIEHEVITDMALLCSGFRPLPESHVAQQSSGFPAPASAESRIAAHLFYDAQDRGCTDGPLEQIAHLARRLSGQQTLEVRATNPSVVHDLPAWCRLAGYELLQQNGDHYVIGRLQKEI